MIGLNDFKRQWNDVREDALEAFSAAGESGWYILGREVAEFEQALGQYWAAPYAVGVASGLDAIEIALRALGCKPGDRVLTTPLSAFATTLAMLKLGAVPVFVDVDQFGSIDLDLCGEALQSRPEIEFFVPVHLYGHALNMRKLLSLREDFGCRIVEDCAQSIGALHSGTPTGMAGQTAATSFYPTKNLGAMGDGGAILTRSADLAGEVRALRDYGQTAKYRHDHIGYNSRLDEVQAALLRRVFLKRLDGWTAARRRIATVYMEGISNPLITAPGAPPQSESCWHLFPVHVAPERKGHFIKWLRQNGVTAGEHYPIAIPDQSALAPGTYEVLGDIQNARRICRSEVSLPIHPYLTDGEIEQVVSACNSWRG